MPADLGDASWSEVDSSNSAAPPNGWPAGMFPNQVEPAARADKGALKRFWDRLNSVFASDGTGTSTAYTLTYPQAASAYYNGEEFSWTVDKTCGASPTLAINGLGAYPLRKFVSGFWQALAAGDIVVNQVVRVRYNSATPSFDMVGQAGGYVGSSVPTGVTMGFRGLISQVPAGWVAERGNSIGDASSGATERANADCQALFTLLWANSNYQLQNASGTNISRGASAAADWAAHCRMVLSSPSGTFRTASNTAGGATGGSSSFSGSTSGSLTVSGSTQNVNALSVNVSQTGQNLQSGSSSFTIANSGTYFLNGGNLTISGGTSGALGVSGTMTPPYVTEISIIKL